MTACVSLVAGLVSRLRADAIQGTRKVAPTKGRSNASTRLPLSRPFWPRATFI